MLDVLSAVAVLILVFPFPRGALGKGHSWTSLKTRWHGSELILQEMINMNKKPIYTGLIQSAEKDPKKRKVIGRIALWKTEDENPLSQTGGE